MPLSPDEFYAHATRRADPDGRLPLPSMTGWDTFPFDKDGLRTVPLARPVTIEPLRHGEGGRECPACSPIRPTVWSDPHWRLSALGRSGTPLVLFLESQAHVDLPDLPDDLAAELGRLTVHTARAIESLPHIARAHVSRWGDGSAHLHVFFFTRPKGFGQLRGTYLAVWDDLLPPVPARQRDADAAAVAEALAASYGGTAS
jgi:hypothetical protein